MTRTVGIVGDRDAVRRFVTTQEGQRVVREIAASAFANADVRLAYERGAELDFHPEIVASVEQHLDRLIDEHYARLDAQENVA